MRRALALAALLALLLTLSLVLPAEAQPVQRRVSYQGVLFLGGSPVTTNTSVTFALFTNAACTSAFPSGSAWSQTLSVTPDAAGVFSALLGSNDPSNAAFFAFAFDRALFLKTSIGGVQVACQALAAVPYALGLYGLRVEPAADPSQEGPNVIGGYSGNSVAAGEEGATIAGGGDPDVGNGNPFPNEVTADYGTVSGGRGNTAGNFLATVGGGSNNMASGSNATVGGGGGNTAGGQSATVGGGLVNEAGGQSATVGGGGSNTASGDYATVGGGLVNAASGDYATVPGGRSNQAGGDYSFAAGRRAIVRDATTTGDFNGDQGTFIWADSENADFQSTGEDQFLIRAAGGVGIGTNLPYAPLHVRQDAVGLLTTAITENETLLVEHDEAIVGLYADDGGTWGAGLVLAEVTPGPAFLGALVDKWAIVRQTTDGAGDSSLRFTFGTDDNYAANDAKVRFDTDGTVHADGAYSSTGADLAEAFAVEGAPAPYEPGDVLVISTRTDRTVEKSTEVYSALVAGVYATKPGVLLGEAKEAGRGERVPMGVVGVIPTKVTLEGGPIRRGDLLVTSSTPGHAMKADPARLGFGMVLGKALAPFEGPGTGLIEVLVNVK